MEVVRGQKTTPIRMLHHVINAKMNSAEIMAAPRTSSRSPPMRRLGRLIDGWNTVSLGPCILKSPCHRDDRAGTGEQRAHQRARTHNRPGCNDRVAGALGKLRQLAAKDQGHAAGGDA